MLDKTLGYILCCQSPALFLAALALLVAYLAGRKHRVKAFFRGKIFSTKPSPFPSSRTSTRSPTRGEIPSRRNFPLARQDSTSVPVST